MSFPGSILLRQGDEFKQTVDKRLPLGTRGYTRDGRVFRYSKADSTGIAIAKLCCGAVPDSDYNGDLNPDTATAPTTGSTTVTLQLATGCTIAANEVKDGYLYINDNTGEGQYVILEGNAKSGTATGAWDVYIRPECAFTVAPTTACEFGILKNKYDDVIIRPDTARTSIPIGVTPRAVTANYYFWLQTWGPCAICLSTLSVAGMPITDDTLTGTGTAGAVHGRCTSTDDVVVGSSPPDLGMVLGYAMNSNATGDYGLCDLTISP